MRARPALLLKQKSFADTSILSKPTTASVAKQRVDLSVEIVRYVVQTKEAEAEAKSLEAARASEKARLDELIRNREGAELPIEELKKQRAAL